MSQLVIEQEQRTKSTAFNARRLMEVYNNAHDMMRNIDGLQPQEAFDELLKFLLVKETLEEEREENPQSGPFDDMVGMEPKRLAESIRKSLSKSVRAEPWLTETWHETGFILSDKCLVAMWGLFSDVSLRQISIDIRSAALRSFLTPELRRGLGIYLTPDGVVQMMVDVLQPDPRARVYDPACGSGTFLIEVLKAWRQIGNKVGARVWGSDKSARMLLLARLNVGDLEGIKFHSILADALTPMETAGWPKFNSFDVILTNPPFGVEIDGQTVKADGYEVAKAFGAGKRRVPSEVLFIEQALKLLKPRGVLGIVLPKSVITNNALGVAREIIGRFGYVTGVVLLPPETFQIAGTQTNTAVLFFNKYDKGEERTRTINIRVVEVTNVGYDSTGRNREGNQLGRVGEDMRQATKKNGNVGLCRLIGPVRMEDSLKDLGAMILGSDVVSPSNNGHKCTRLGDVAELVKTGKTPPRANYTDKGLFLVKVGNLTGHGIDWMPRDRNFVPSEYATKATLLRKLDIVLTSSAHSPNYIAKKVDIVGAVPEWVGGKASLVGEVMLVRAKHGAVDPLALLAYLRHPDTMERIQRMVRGQTAHLHPNDLMMLEIPAYVMTPSSTLHSLTDILREELKLSARLNFLAERQATLSNKMAL